MKPLYVLTLSLTVLGTANTGAIAKGTSTSTSTATVVEIQPGGTKPVSGMGLGGSRIAGGDVGSGR